MHFAILLRLSDIPIPVPHAQHPTTRARASSEYIGRSLIVYLARGADRRAAPAGPARRPGSLRSGTVSD